MLIFLWNSWYLELILKRCPRTKKNTSGKHWQLPSLQQPQEQLLQQILLQFLTQVSFWKCLCSYTCDIIHPIANHLCAYWPTPLGNEVPQLVPCPGVDDPKVFPPGALYVPHLCFGLTKPPPPKLLEPRVCLG